MQVVIGFSYKETTLFIISTVKLKQCTHEKFFQHCQIKARLCWSSTFSESGVQLHHDREVTGTPGSIEQGTLVQNGLVPTQVSCDMDHSVLHIRESSSQDHSASTLWITSEVN